MKRQLGKALVVIFAVVITASWFVPQERAGAEQGPYTELNARSSRSSTYRSTDIPRSPSIDPDKIEVVGHLGGPTNAVVVQGDYAYIGQGTKIVVVNIANEAAPTPVGELTLFRGIVEDITIVGEYAFVADRAGMRVVNIGNPAAPMLIGSYDTTPYTESTRHIEVRGSTAYLADVYSGIVHIIDVSNPVNPIEVGSLSLGWVNDIDVRGSYLYALLNDEILGGGMAIFDLSNPESPTRESFYDIYGSVYSISVDGAYAYVATQNYGLLIIDVHDPAHPVDVADIGGYAFGFGEVEVAGDYAYYFLTPDFGDDGVAIIDVSNPAQPLWTGHYTSGLIYGMAVANNLLFLAASYDGLQLVSLDDTANPSLVSVYETLEQLYSVDTSGAFAYGSTVNDQDFQDGDSVLAGVSIVNPHAPYLASSLTLPHRAYDIAISGNLAYLATGHPSGLLVVDITNPLSPREIATIDIAGIYVAVQGNYAYVVWGYSGTMYFTSIDMSQPASPRVLDTVGINYNSPTKPIIKGSYAYLAGIEFSIIDISDPTSLTTVASFWDGPYSDDVAVVGDYAYLCDYSEGQVLSVLDISNHDYSTPVGSYNIDQYCMAIVAGGDYLYLITSTEAQYTNEVLRVIDISEPTNPVEVGFYDLAGYVSDLVVDANNIYIAGDHGLAILRFVGEAPGYSISGYVRDQAAAPLAGVSVCTSNGACATTDTSGTYRINNLAAGSYTLTSAKFGYTFAPTTRSVTVPPSTTGIDFTGTSTGDVPTAILQEAQSMVAAADEVLAGAEDDALGVIEEIIYLRGAVANFSIKFVSGLVRGLLDDLQALASNTDDLPVDEAFPGWKAAVLKSPTFCKLSNAFVSKVSEGAFSEQDGLKRATRLALNSGLYALAAYNENKCLGDLREDLILDSVGIGNLLLAHLERPFAQTPVARKIADSRDYLEQQLAILQAAKVPPMGQTVINGYVADLRARKFANTVYRDQLHDALLTLEAVHAANEAEPWGGDVLQLVLRSAAQFGAARVADGPGSAAVKKTLLVFDSYMDGKALIESYRMLLVANGALLKTAPEVVQKVTDNTAAGLAQIAAGDGPATPQGSILGIEHYSGGKYLDPLALWWQEREAYSWVTIKNTGTAAGDFTVVGRYLGETTRLTLPWATLWLRASSDPVRLLPGQSIPVQLIYRTGDIGYSPREARTIGNVPASSISVDLLGINETGTFHLDYYSNEWQPARATMANGVMTFVEQPAETTAAVVDEVLVSAIDGGPGREYQTGFLWVNNPFDATVPVALAQPLPDGVTVLDSGGGSVTADEIAWSGTVGPLETGFFEYTMAIDSPPGTAVTFPAATLELTAPGDQALTVSGEEQVVTIPWPILIDRDTPDWILPHTAATLTLNAANFAPEPVAGALTVEIWTAAGQQLQREEKPLSVAAESDQQVTFDWPDTLDIGDYEVRGFLLLGGREDQVFADPVSVGAPPPRLSLAVSPVNDDGTVALGGVLDYTFAIENASDMALTNVVAGFTLPTDVEVIAISDAGARAGAEIRWPLGTIAAGATRTLTVQARVPLGFVAPNEGRYLESAPFLTAAESPDATGAAVTVLVLGPEGVAAPTLTGFTPTSGPASTSVTITGTTLTGATAVTFNGVNAASFTVNSATQITAVVPAGATTGKIAVTTPGGTATSAADFTVLPPPTISGFSPASGPAGTSVTISGTAFSGATVVTFNGTNAASFTVGSATQITAIVPAGATTGKIAVTTPGGTATSAADFTVMIPPPFPDVFYLSPSANVTVGGIAAQGADVLRYTKSTNSWAMIFDGSNHGLTKNVSAFTFLDDGSLLFVLTANQTIAGLGAATPYDVVKFTPNMPGVFPLGAGTFSWYFQGKPKGLTTTGEKIDAIDVVGSQLLLSITGGGSVPKQGGGVLKPADEDVFVWNLTANAFEAALLIDGSKMTGMAVEDISGLWDDPQSSDYYATIVGAFNLGGVKGNDKSIVKLTPNGGTSVYTPSLVTWLAAGATLPTAFKIDGIELVR